METLERSKLPNFSQLYLHYLNAKLLFLYFAQSTSHVWKRILSETIANVLSSWQLLQHFCKMGRRFLWKFFNMKKTSASPETNVLLISVANYYEQLTFFWIALKKISYTSGPWIMEAIFAKERVVMNFWNFTSVSVEKNWRAWMPDDCAHVICIYRHYIVKPSDKMNKFRWDCSAKNLFYV